MRFTAAIAQRGRNRWKRAVESIVTIVVLLAVAVGGIVLFGSEVSAVWKAPGNANQALASDGAFAGLLNFEAPAATVARFEAAAKEYEKNQTQAANFPLLVKNWKYTQIIDPLTTLNLFYLTGIDNALFLLRGLGLYEEDNASTFDSAVPGINLQNLITAINDLFQASPGGLPQLITNFYLQQLSTALYQQATILEAWQNAFLNNLNVFGQGLSSSFPSLSPLLNAYFNALQNQVNSFVTSYVQTAQALQNIINTQLPTSLRPPPIPPASPSS
jgi:hypothetical protein